MKKNKIIVSLALGLLLTSCAQPNSKDKENVSEETIAQALDGDSKDLEKSEKTLKTDKKTKDNESSKMDTDDWREAIVDIGEFSNTLAKNLSDEQIDELVDEASEKSDETGYWDVKDFVFQELSRQYPELSEKFPLDTIGRREEWVASKEGEFTGKFEYERRVMADWGYPADAVWSVDDKAIEDAFHEAYKEDPLLFYEDYVENAADLLFEDDNDTSDSKDEEDQADTTSQDLEEKDSDSSKTDSSNTQKIKLKKYGSSQTDYDAIKSALVQYYEFSPSSVNQMTNEDIDIAYTRAAQRLEETGFGDIGLIFEELGKMYPGASTMYPGNEGVNSESNN